MADEEKDPKKKPLMFKHPATGEIHPLPIDSGMVNDIKESLNFPDVKDDIQRQRREERRRRGLE